MPNNQAQYNVVLQIDRNLISTYGKALPFKPEMDGWAEIITEDMSLLQCVVNKFWSFSK